MPASLGAAHLCELREAGAAGPPSNEGPLEHYAGVHRHFPVRHWSDLARRFRAPRRVPMAGYCWCFNAGVSM